jgi:GTP-binding protein EngB required for normal cell division
MVNKNAQEWLDKKYLIKERNKIAELDISQGKAKEFFVKITLKDGLELLKFNNLKKLIISGHELTNLDVSGCPNLEELDCQNNQLTSLNIEGCANLKKINCSGNKIKKLDLSDCSNLEEVDLSNCSKELAENKQAIKFSQESNLIFTIKKDKLVKGPLITPVEGNVRNILIVGWTGGGKSTLANVLTNTNEFRESNYGVSKTDKYQVLEGKKYRIIDNIGFGDTRSDLSEEEVIDRIGAGILSAKEGINQILFVVKGRFSEEHTKAFKLFERSISETGITKFTTIIITGFENFKNKELCERDKEGLIRESKDLREMIESCKGVIHIDNPSINIPPADDEDDEEKEDRIRRENANKKKREESGKIVLNHLDKNCSEIYKLREWDDLYSMIVKGKEIENNLTNAKNKSEKVAIEKEKKSWFKELKAKLAVNVPGLPVGLEAQIEITK